MAKLKIGRTKKLKFGRIDSRKVIAKNFDLALGKKVVLSFREKKYLLETSTLCHSFNSQVVEDSTLTVPSPRLKLKNER